MDFDRRHLAAQHRRLAAGRRARVEDPLAVARVESQRPDLRAAALRPDAPFSERRWIDALDAVGARHVGRLSDRLGGANDELARLVLRLGERDRLVEAPVAFPDLEDPVRIRLLERPFRERRDKLLEALGEPPRHRVRESRRPLEPFPADELDRVVCDRMGRSLAPRELVRRDAERRQHRGIELPRGALPERVDPVVDRAHPLHRPVGDPLGERAVALVEPGRSGREGPVGVRLVLEHAPHDLERRAAGGGDQRVPRANSS